MWLKAPNILFCHGHRQVTSPPIVVREGKKQGETGKEFGKGGSGGGLSRGR